MPVTNQVVLAKELSNHGDSALSLLFWTPLGKDFVSTQTLMPEPNINHTVSRLDITYGVPYVLTFSSTDLN